MCVYINMYSLHSGNPTLGFLYIYTSIHIYTDLGKVMHIYMHIYICICMYAYVYVYVRVYFRKSDPWLPIYIYIDELIYIFTCIHMYIHTHIYTYIFEYQNVCIRLCTCIINV